MKIFRILIKILLVLFLLNFFVYNTDSDINTIEDIFHNNIENNSIINTFNDTVVHNNEKYIIVYEPEMRFIYESDNNLSEIDKFLLKDKTDEGKYQVWHSCGHFVRELSKNASKQNISLGGAIFGNHPTFRGYDISHAMNYYYDENGNLWFIEPQLDRRYSIEYLKSEGSYRYIRLYHDGTQLPSNWDGNLAHHIKLY